MNYWTIIAYKQKPRALAYTEALFKFRQTHTEPMTNHQEGKLFEIWLDSHDTQPVTHTATHAVATDDETIRRMHQVEKLSNREIARRLGISEATVRRRLKK